MYPLSEQPQAATRPVGWLRGIALACLLGFVPLALTAGCAPSASVRFADLNFKRLDPSDPLIIDVEADSCWWWIEGERVCIALEVGSAKSHGIGPRERLVFSLVLDGIPAGDEREYRFGKPAMRCYRHKGRNHARYASVRGVATIQLLPDEVLSGRFRVSARKQVFHVLTNWTTVGQTLVMGEFAARRGRERGSSILVETEEAGMKRRSSGDTMIGGVPQPRKIVGPDVP